jgi:nicotinamidase-related amidase
MRRRRPERLCRVEFSNFHSSSKGRADWEIIDAEFTRAALLVLDVQKAIDAAYHAAEGPRNNPDAEKNIGLLLAAWRRDNWPIIHIRHDSTFPASAYRRGQEGNNFKDEVAPAAGPFARRDFHGRLRTADEVHSMSLANLHEEYCTVLDTAAVLADRCVKPVFPLWVESSPTTGGSRPK